ncbi:MAG: hypothetical protein RIR18_515 [Pseudomonadota bacterium]
MDAFIWDKRFETGISSVDEQHKRLVALTNVLGNKLLQGDVPEAQLQHLFHELAEYSRYHFENEENLMREAHVDERHIKEHIAHHHQFVQQVVSLWQTRARLAHPGETLHGFLRSWLTAHILGEDQAMSRQMAFVTGGVSPQQAYQNEKNTKDNITDILLDSMGRLYALLAEQNHNLSQTNELLEQRVQERTLALTLANEQLEKEQSELTALLAKVEKAQQQLLQTEKMAAVGQLAAGVAHEINNPIGFVNSNLGTLRKYVGTLFDVVEAYQAGDPRRIEQTSKVADLAFLKADVGPLLDESQEGLSRVTKIVQELKNFSHVDDVGMQEADLNEGLENTLSMAWHEVKHKACIVRQMGNLPPVLCVAAQINQVFMSVLLNAVQALDKPGVITLRSGVENGYVWVDIEDTGRGMSQEVRKRLFEPFFTTKRVGEGTGLGLSISYDIIVNKHNGYIDVVSTEGSGTKVRIGLPVKVANL